MHKQLIFVLIIVTAVYSANNNVVIGDGNTVQGNSNVQVGSSSNLTGNQNLSVGDDHDIVGNGIEQIDSTTNPTSSLTRQNIPQFVSSIFGSYTPFNPRYNLQRFYNSGNS